jgi:hypothetical protein
MQKFKKEKGRSGRPETREIGKRERTVHSQPADSQCYSVGCISENKKEYVEFEVKESKTAKLKFLLDTAADICLVKNSKLLGTTESDPQQKVKLKSIDGSVVETHGIVKLCVHEGELKIPFDFHLVNKQVELVYDVIVGRDFLQHTRAKVCNDSNTVTFKTGSGEWTKKILGSEVVQGAMEMRKLTLPESSEVAVKLPVGNGTDGQEVTIKIVQGTMEERKLKLPGRSELIVKLTL